LKCVELEGNHLEHASDACKQDREIVATAVKVAKKQDGWARPGNFAHRTS
jgi:hypothetical protein